VLEPLVEELGVLLLDMGGVAQHPAAEIDGAGVEKMGPEKPFFTSVGGSRNGRCGRVREPRHRWRNPERKIAILAVGLFPAALVQPAIEQKAPAARFHQVHGAGDLARRAPKRDLHLPPAKNMMFTRKRHSSALRNRKGRFCLGGGACFSLPV